MILRYFRYLTKFQLIVQKNLQKSKGLTQLLFYAPQPDRDVFISDSLKATLSALKVAFYEFGIRDKKLGIR